MAIQKILLCTYQGLTHDFHPSRSSWGRRQAWLLGLHLEWKLTAVKLALDLHEHSQLPIPHRSPPSRACDCHYWHCWHSIKTEVFYPLNFKSVKSSGHLYRCTQIYTERDALMFPRKIKPMELPGSLRVHFYKHGGHIYLKREKGNKFFLPITHLAGHFPPKAKPTYKTHNVLVKCRHPTFGKYINKRKPNSRRVSMTQRWYSRLRTPRRGSLRALSPVFLQGCQKSSSCTRQGFLTHLPEILYPQKSPSWDNSTHST